MRVLSRRVRGYVGSSMARCRVDVLVDLGLKARKAGLVLELFWFGY